MWMEPPRAAAACGTRKSRSPPFSARTNKQKAKRFLRQAPSCQAASYWPLSARAQQPQMRRIGVLMGFGESDSEVLWLSSFIRASRELGWTDGRNVRLEIRWGASDLNRQRMYARELVRLQRGPTVGGLQLNSIPLSERSLIAFAFFDKMRKSDRLLPLTTRQFNRVVHAATHGVTLCGQLRQPRCRLPPWDHRPSWSGLLQVHAVHLDPSSTAVPQRACRTRTRKCRFDPARSASVPSRRPRKVSGTKMLCKPKEFAQDYKKPTFPSSSPSSLSGRVGVKHFQTAPSILVFDVTRRVTRFSSGSALWPSS
jgi:hypothetical protein